MSDKPKRGRPRSPDHSTPPRQFRLSDDTLAELDYLQERYGLTSRTEVIRFLARRATIDERRKDGAK